MAAQGYCPSHGCWQVVKAEHEQERPTRRAVGVQELAGLGIEAAQEGGEGTQGGVGTQGRPRRIRVPFRTAPGDVRESWV